MHRKRCGIPCLRCLGREVIAIFAHADFFNCFLHRYFSDEAQCFRSPERLL